MSHMFADRQHVVRYLLHSPSHSTGKKRMCYWEDVMSLILVYTASEKVLKGVDLLGSWSMFDNFGPKELINFYPWVHHHIGLWIGDLIFRVHEVQQPAVGIYWVLESHLHLDLAIRIGPHIVGPCRCMPELPQPENPWPKHGLFVLQSGRSIRAAPDFDGSNKNHRDKQNSGRFSFIGKMRTINMHRNVRHGTLL